MTARLTTSAFITKASKIHNNKYDYSNVSYNKTEDKISIKCKIHGIFEQIAKDHIQGYGCAQCGGTKKLSTSAFITKASKIHNNKYLYTKTNYINIQTKVKIECREHGTFTQSPMAHLYGKRGCIKCARHKNISNNMGLNNFIKKSHIIHMNKYLYDDTIYVNAHTPVTITCLEHGKFNQTPTNHIWNKTGCPSCGKIHHAKSWTYHERWFATNPDTKKLPGIFYIREFISESEQFIKIGITLDNNKLRFYSKHKQYKINTIKQIKMPIYSAYTLEQHLLLNLKEYKYKPLVRFGGMSECLINNVGVIKTVMDNIESITGVVHAC